GGDDAVVRGPDRDLHLHRLEDTEDVARLDGLAGTHAERVDEPGHRGGDLPALRDAGPGPQPLPEPHGVDLAVVDDGRRGVAHVDDEVVGGAVDLDAEAVGVAGERPDPPDAL